MVVTRRAPAAPVTSPRSNSSQASPRKGRAVSQSDIEELSHLSDDVISTASHASGNQDKKGKQKGKLKKQIKKEKRRKNTLTDLFARAIILFFTIYTLSVCPEDDHLKSPVCRGLYHYRRLVLEPYIFPPIQNALAHPSVAPYVDRVAPTYHATVARAQPIAARAQLEWRKRVVPQWQKRVVPQWRRHAVPRLRVLERQLAPYRARIAAEYDSRVAPSLRFALAHLNRFQGAAQPYVILAAHKSHEGFTRARPYARPAWERVKELLSHLLALLAAQRRQFVDPHIAQIWEKVKELGGTPAGKAVAQGTAAAKSGVSSLSSSLSASASSARRSASSKASSASVVVSAATESAVGTAASVLPAVIETTSSWTSSSKVAASMASVTSAISASSASSGIPSVASGASSMASGARSSVSSQASNVASSGSSAVTSITDKLASSASSAASVVSESAHSLKDKAQAATSFVTEAAAETASSASSIASVQGGQASNSATSVAAPVVSAAAQSSRFLKKAIKSASSSITATAQTLASSASIAGSGASSRVSASASSVAAVASGAGVRAASSASSAGSAASSVVADDTDDFLAQLGLSDDPNAPDVPSPSPSADSAPNEETDEEKAARLAAVAKKRAGIIARHSKWEQNLEEKITERGPLVRAALARVRTVAATELQRSPEMSAEVDALVREAEKLLGGAEGYLKTLSKEGRPTKDKTALWVRVIDKVEAKFTARLDETEAIVNGWWAGVVQKELAEIELHVSAVREVADAAQADLGLEYAWLDDVTYQDWQRYHDLGRRTTAFSEEAERVQNGTHPEPLANPVISAIADLEAEVKDVLVGFETRLRRIKRTGDRTLVGAPADEQAPAEPAPTPGVSILPVPPAPADVRNAPPPVVIGRGKEEVFDALGRVEEGEQTEASAPRGRDALPEDIVGSLAAEAEAEVPMRTEL